MDAATFHAQAQKALQEAAEKAEQVLISGNFPDFCTYRYAVGRAKGLRDASASLYDTYKILVEGATLPKENGAGRKSADKSVY